MLRRSEHSQCKLTTLRCYDESLIGVAYAVTLLRRFVTELCNLTPLRCYTDLLIGVAHGVTLFWAPGGPIC